jgi:DnaJ-domain-containing protein 1
MLEQIFERLATVLSSYLRGKPTATRNYSDPYMREAWEELNAYLNDEEYSRKDRSEFRENNRDESGGSSSESGSPLRQDYANLELDLGAPFSQVKKSYKRLLRIYHPDRFAANPEKLKLATEITKMINASYQRIKTHVGGQRT